MKNNVFFISVFCLGVLFGTFCTYIINEYIVSTIYFSNIETIKNHTNEKLIHYIEGKWSSAAGEVIINIDPIQNIGKLTIFEKNKQLLKKYNILNVEFVDGFFGYTTLLICDVDNCMKNHKIQINKIFGIDDVIVITYSPEISDCIEMDKLCSRAFRLIK